MQLIKYSTGSPSVRGITVPKASTLNTIAGEECALRSSTYSVQSELWLGGGSRGAADKRETSPCMFTESHRGGNHLTHGAHGGIKAFNWIQDRRRSYFFMLNLKKTYWLDRNSKANPRLMTGCSVGRGEQKMWGLEQYLRSGVCTGGRVKLQNEQVKT